MYCLGLAYQPSWTKGRNGSTTTSTRFDKRYSENPGFGLKFRIAVVLGLSLLGQEQVLVIASRREICRPIAASVQLNPYLECIPESRMSMPQKMLRLRFKPLVSVPTLPLLIFPMAIHHLSADGDQTKDQSSQAERMTEEIPGSEESELE